MTQKKTLDISPDLSLPLQAVTWAFAVLSTRRAGKSNTLVVMAEEMTEANLHWIAIDPKGDWWGIQSSGDGLSAGLEVPIFGGEHGNFPIYPDSGAELADLLVFERISALIDVSEFSKREMIRFLGGTPNRHGFFGQLYKNKNRNQPPTHVFMEEVDEYLHQTVTAETAKLHNDGQKIVTKGGYRGLGATCATQRPARFHNDVLTQTDTMIAGRNLAHTEVKQVQLWIQSFLPKDNQREIIESLAGLANGQQWVISPHNLDFVGCVQMRRRRTLDSGATPDVFVHGERRPPTLAEIDSSAISDRLAATIERAKADDPEELKKQIAILERQLAEKPKVEPAALPPPEQVFVPFLDEKTLGELDSAIDDFDVSLPALVEYTVEVDKIVARMKKAVIEFRNEPVPAALQKPGEVTVHVDGREVARAAEAKMRRKESMVEDSPRRAAPEDSPDGDAGQLAQAEKAIMTVLAQFPGGRTKTQLAVQTGYSTKSSTIKNTVGAMRSKGWATSGWPVQLTDEGRSVIGFVKPLPVGSDLVDWWVGELPEAPGKILRLIVDTYTREKRLLTKPEIAEATGYSVTSSTVKNAIGRLRTLDLVRGFEPNPLLLDEAA